jgi:predicted alpha-1,6-mannanase (GH76 family)
MEILIVILAILVGMLLFRVIELQKRLDIFDKWADWIEEEIINAPTFVLDLGGDDDAE